MKNQCRFSISRVFPAIAHNNQMKLAAIYNIFDGEEHLPHSVACIARHVDQIIIIYQLISNYGEHYDPYPVLEKLNRQYPHVQLYCYQPDNGKAIPICNNHPAVNADLPVPRSPMQHETRKRQLGINIASYYGCTHFLHLDTDELWPDFEQAKQAYLQHESAGHIFGSVARMYTYFKQPNWRLQNPEGYYVPFIHQLRPGAAVGQGQYPYHTDPTRRVLYHIGMGPENVLDLTAATGIHMHHLSWVRNNIQRKAQNSTAAANIARGTLLHHYHHPSIGPGYYLTDYEQTLVLDNTIAELFYKTT